MANILVFKTGDTCSGIDTSYVRVITKNPEWAGNTVVEYDGQKAHVINPFHKREETFHGADFIVVSCKGRNFVMPIGEVVDIYQVMEKDISPIPLLVKKTIPKNLFQGVFCVNDTLVLLLDVSMFSEDVRN